MTERLARLEEQIKAIKDTLESLNDKIDSLGKVVVPRPEIEAKIGPLEKAVYAAIGICAALLVAEANFVFQWLMKGAGVK